MGLGLWRLRYFAEWLPRDGPQIGYRMALRKHWNLLKSWKAPQRMPPLSLESRQDSLSVHLMTGEFHWHLTCFCLYSLLEQTTKPVVPLIHDDGSLNDHQRSEMSRIIPTIRFVTPQESDEVVADFVPPSRYPALHGMRKQLALTRKLIDTHAGSRGPALFLDSDILFFQSPEFLLEWLASGRQPIFMLDYQNSYGYSPEALLRAYGKPVPARVNTGLAGFYSPDIDWDKLEFWSRRLVEAEGINHFSEQALTAMMMGELNGACAPPEDYIVSPDLPETLSPRAVMHHYVVPSRTWYYTDAIPAFLRRVTGTGL